MWCGAGAHHAFDWKMPQAGPGAIAQWQQAPLLMKVSLDIVMYGV